MRQTRLAAAACCVVLSGTAGAGQIGIGTLSGTYDSGGIVTPVKGYIAIVDMAANVVPLATQPDTGRCERQAPLLRETTLAWQARNHALVAINASFFRMPASGAADCQLAPFPYKAHDFSASLPFSGTLAPAVLALRQGAARIGYADQFDTSRFDIVISGDSVRGKDGAAMHHRLLVAGNRVDSGSALHARTAVGIQRDTGRLVVVMIEGRPPYSGGLSLDGLASIMLACGVSDAINLDGGGSATFSYAPEFQPAATEATEALEALEPIPLARACEDNSLKADPLSLSITQHPLNEPLRSRAPGGKETSSTGPDKGYRRVLTNLGLRFDRPTPATARETAP